MSANIDTNFERYLSNNLGLMRGMMPQYSQNEASTISALAEISIHKLSDNVLRVTKEFLKSLSSECMSEYINRTNDEGQNIFFFCRDVELMKYIIEYVHDINAVCKNGSTALTSMCDHNIIQLTNVEIIELLLENSADVNATNVDGSTALASMCNHHIIQSNGVEIIELLLEHGANINTTNVDGYTPLMNYCAKSSYSLRHPWHNFENVVELLIRKGADPLMKSNMGCQAYDFVGHKTLLSESISQLLRGEISMARTKSAAKIE